MEKILKKTKRALFFVYDSETKNEIGLFSCKLKRYKKWKQLKDDEYINTISDIELSKLLIYLSKKQCELKDIDCSK